MITIPELYIRLKHNNHLYFISMQDTFYIKQRLTLSEFTSATLFYYLSGKYFRRGIIFILAFLTAIELFMAFTFPNYSFQLLKLLFYIIPLIFLFLTGIFIIMSYCLITHKFNPGRFVNVSYEITHWGVTRHGNSPQFSQPWRNIKAFKESRSFFILYTFPTGFHIIQKNELRIPGEIDNLRNFLKEKLHR